MKIYAVLFCLLTTSAASLGQTVRIPADGQEFSTALTAAIRRLPNGGTVQLEAGTYIVARPCDPAGTDNVTIQGVGPRTVIQFHQRYFGKEDRWLMNVTDEHDHWTFKDFTFDGNSRFSPRVCDRDKIVKLRGDFFTVERVTVQNEAGRGFVTILGNDSRWLNCTFNNIGTNAGDSSVVHPGNKFLHAHRVLVSGCMGDLGRGHKTTFVDAVASDVIVTNNIIRGGKTGVILSWWKGAPENAVISNNILQSSGRSCRLNRKRKQGEYPRVIITNNVLVGPLQNQFGSGFVDAGNTLTEPLRIQEPGFKSKN